MSVYGMKVCRHKHTHTHTQLIKIKGKAGFVGSSVM